MARFAEFADVAGRYEKPLSGDRAEWVELRLNDAESELIGLVPDLAADIETLDPARVGRVRRLISDKVLDLLRNPDGASSVTSTMGPLSAVRTLRSGAAAKTSWVAFTEQELASVGAVLNTGSSGSVILRAYGYP